MRDTNPPIPLRYAPAEKKVFKRRRCQNCNKLYLPTREDQKFCRTLPDRDKCRKEFYRYGSSYGPLKTGLHKAIDNKCAELRAEFRTLKRVVDALTKEVEYCYSVHKTLTVERAQADAQTQAR